jgi:hypothetical protein
MHFSSLALSSVLLVGSKIAQSQLVHSNTTDIMPPYLDVEGADDSRTFVFHALSQNFVSCFMPSLAVKIPSDKSNTNAACRKIKVHHSSFGIPVLRLFQLPPKAANAGLDQVTGTRTAEFSWLTIQDTLISILRKIILEPNCVRRSSNQQGAAAKNVLSLSSLHLGMVLQWGRVV